MRVFYVSICCMCLLFLQYLTKHSKVFFNVKEIKIKAHGKDFQLSIKDFSNRQQINKIGGISNIDPQQEPRNLETTFL